MSFHSACIPHTSTKSTKLEALRPEIFLRPPVSLSLSLSISLSILGPNVSPQSPVAVMASQCNAHLWTAFIPLTGPSSCAGRFTFLLLRFSSQQVEADGGRPAGQCVIFQKPRGASPLQASHHVSLPAQFQDRHYQFL